jgi:hypothetical protein
MATVRRRVQGLPINDDSAGRMVGSVHVTTGTDDFIQTIVVPVQPMQEPSTFASMWARYGHEAHRRPDTVVQAPR